MITGSNPVAGRRMAIAVAMFALLALATMVSACGSSGHATATAASTAVAESTCEQVGDALSDGPDPDADPLGYAEAQVKPLQQIHATSATLGQAITTLAGAYNSYYQANGTGAAKSALNTAIKQINKLCPDAGAAA
ncbi:MAG: hypothetical protein ABSB59_32510 [Streptosporangiaceae bacterium]|jgi:hypothetical protein